MIRKNDYSLVLMDQQMPIMGGVEATQIIRADPSYANLPIIAMTANVMAEDINRCLDSGMNDHISKPIDFDHFFSVLVKWIKPLDL
jgi:CheY-like chemotaxis protein